MAATRTTTTTRALCYAAAIALLAMGAGRLLTGMNEIERAGLVKPLEEQRILVSTQRDRLNDDHDTTGLNMAAMAALGSAPRVDASGRSKLFNLAYEKQTQALQHNVADPYGWVRIAYLDMVMKNDRKHALDALRLSVQAAPYEPQLMVKRAQAFHELSDLYISDDARLMQREWQYAFRGDKDGLVKLLKTKPELVPVVDKAMEADSDPDYVGWWRTKKKENSLN